MFGVNKFNRGQFLNLQIQKGEGRTQQALRGPASTPGPHSAAKTELRVRLDMSSTRCTLVKVHLWVGPPQRRRPLGFGGLSSMNLNGVRLNYSAGFFIYFSFLLMLSSISEHSGNL